MTRQEFDKLLSSCKFPVSMAIDMDGYICAPNIWGCTEHKGKWFVYKTDYLGDIESEEEFDTEGAALDFFAKRLGILSSMSAVIDTSSHIVVPVRVQRKKDIKEKYLIIKYSADAGRIACEVANLRINPSDKVHAGPNPKIIACTIREQKNKAVKPGQNSISRKTTITKVSHDVAAMLPQTNKRRTPRAVY